MKIDELLESGIDINKKSGKDGSTLLIRAVCMHQLCIVQKLIAAGADVNATDFYGSTALIFSSNNGNSRIVKELIIAGANPEIANHDGQTAYDVAANQEIRALLELVRFNQLLAPLLEGNACYTSYLYTLHPPDMLENITKLIAGKTLVEQISQRQISFALDGRYHK